MNQTREQQLPVANNYIIVRKRVGGGYKQIKTKIADTLPPPPIKQEEKEKQEFEEKGKADISLKETKQRFPSVESFESLHLPLSSTDLRRENSCEGKVRYEDYPILQYIQDNVIGNNLNIEGPFGTKRVVYCDYTASGRSLSFIEDYIREYVCPFYANTHSETGRNARQTSKFREEARSIIKKCVNAGKDDVVIFTGSGATGGLHKVAWGLKIQNPRVAEETVVLTGPYEHHANILLWKEFGTTVIRIRDGPDGLVDVGHLVSELKFWKDKRRQILVCMSAASNVTGIITDTEEIARISHQYGAYVAFDYAGGGPYLKIDMNPSKQSYKDAVFLSPHKFVGGPGSPGIIVAKKWMFKNQVPDRVGGGTVVYVSRDSHSYTTDIEAREEGGTPAIIESIRTGLAFQLKNAIGEDLISTRDEDLCCRAFSVWEKNPNLIVLGSHNSERITIFSFVVKHTETGKFIHYNFISTLLNDLFGIQSRGGCACAGPYGHDLLGISEPMAKRLKWFTNIQPGMDSACPQYPVGIMRPGFCRVNLPYFFDDETIDYIINAVDMVATHGWRLLPKYTFNTLSGAFVYKGDGNERTEEDLFSLGDVDYSNMGRFHVNRHPPKLDTKISLNAMTKAAENVLKDTTDQMKVRQSSASKRLKDVIPKDRNRLRWFLTPQEANDVITGNKKVKRVKPIMIPRVDVRITEEDSLEDTYRSRISDPSDTIGSKESRITEKLDISITANRRRVGDKYKKQENNLQVASKLEKLKIQQSVDETSKSEEKNYTKLNRVKEKHSSVKKDEHTPR